MVLNKKFYWFAHPRNSRESSYGNWCV